MSSTSSEQLTEEQQKFLAALEEEFKDRYTEKDEEFKAILEETLPQPPLMENWREFRPMDERRNYPFRPKGYDQGESHGYRRYQDRPYRYEDRYPHSSSHRGSHWNHSEYRYRP